MDDNEQFLPPSPLDIIDPSHELVSLEIPESPGGDAKYARDSIISAIQDGQNAIRELAGFASQSQDNKDYIALSRLLNSVVIASKTLMEIHEKNKKLTEEPEDKEKNPKTVNNNLFVGTTADLLRNIKRENE